MVLNLMTVKIFPFLPGRGWRKKGEPVLVIARINVRGRRRGTDRIKTIRARRKSAIGLKKTLYIGKK
jgi:hypothetical protein